MLERYRVLGAVATLGEFTVDDIANLSGVGPTTIRTVLRRDARFVEKIGVSETGKKGGRFLRYKVRENQFSRLVGELRGLERALRFDVDAPKDQQERLLAAEDLLVRVLPQANDEAERAALLERAKIAWLDAFRKAGLEGSPGGEVEASGVSADPRASRQLAVRIEAVGLLISHATSDFASAAFPFSSAKELVRIREEIFRFLRNVPHDLFDSAESDNSRLLAELYRLAELPAPPVPADDFAASVPGRAKALMGHTPTPEDAEDPSLLDEVQFLRQRVRDLEAEVERLRTEREMVGRPSQGYGYGPQVPQREEEGAYRR